MAVTTGGLLQVVTTAAGGASEAHDVMVGPMETPIIAVGFSPDGGLLAAGVGGNVNLWNTSDWSQAAVLGHGTENVHLLSFSPDGRALVTVDNGNMLRIWRVP